MGASARGQLTVVWVDSSLSVGLFGSGIGPELLVDFAITARAVEPIRVLLPHAKLIKKKSKTLSVIGALKRGTTRERLTVNCFFVNSLNSCCDEK